MNKELSELSLEELWELFPIILAEHNPAWDEWYDDESKHLQGLLKNIDVVRIAHIGSTSIRNIWAKPIVDILIELRNGTDFDSVHDILVNHGYICMEKNNIHMGFNKGYTKSGFAERVFHIHIRILGDHEELYFRDYLNEHPFAAKEYEELKLSLWKQFEHNRDAYTAAKTEFVKKYTTKAKENYMITERMTIYPLSDEQLQEKIDLESNEDLKVAFTQMLAGCKEHPEQRIWYTIWVMRLNTADKEIVGDLSFKGLIEGTVEIGYGIKKAYEGQGLMTEAVMAMAKWASNQSGVVKVEAETDSDNIISQKVLCKSGFMENGTKGEEGPRFTYIKK